MESEHAFSMHYQVQLRGSPRSKEAECLCILYIDFQMGGRDFGGSFLHSTGNIIRSSEVPRNPLTRWDVSSIPANGIFLTKKLKKQK